MISSEQVVQAAAGPPLQASSAVANDEQKHCASARRYQLIVLLPGCLPVEHPRGKAQNRCPGSEKYYEKACFC
jgi:hypothetical protein